MKARTQQQQPLASKAISSVQPVLELASLNLFHRRQVQLIIASEKQMLIDLSTVYSADTDIQFHIPGTDQFMSPHVYLVINVKIKNGNNSLLAAAAPVAL